LDSEPEGGGFMPREKGNSYPLSARIAANGTLLTEDLLRRIRNETLTMSFQVSLDTLDGSVYEQLHGCGRESLGKALWALRWICELGFHTTVSTRLSPATLPGIPALLDKAAEEDSSTVTVHCPLHTGRMGDAFPQNADVFALLQGVFDHFLAIPRHWLVETTMPWAPFHPLVQKLSERISVTLAGCGAGRCRLAIGPSGGTCPCICTDLVPFAQIGNVRTHSLGPVFPDSAIARLMRSPREQGICTDCAHVSRCGGGCRSARPGTWRQA
jgi:radical SAM protein with 4Fe4S-binding SPASM domain